MMIRVPAVVAENGDALAEALEGKGYAQVDVSLSEGEWVVNALTANGTPVDGRSRAAVEALARAHTGEKTPRQKQKHERNLAVAALLQRSAAWSLGEMEQVVRFLAAREGKL